MKFSARMRFDMNRAKLLCLTLVLSSSGLSASSPWQEDVAYYRTEVFEADGSYSEDERHRGEQLLRQLEEKLDDMTPAQIELSLAEVSALTNNGHSFLMPGGWTERYRALPIRFHVFSDGIHVIDAQPGLERYLGLRLVSINGHSSTDLSSAWNRYQGGLQSWKNVYLPYFLESPAMLRAAGLAESEDSVRVVLVDAEGQETIGDFEPNNDFPPLQGIDLFLAPSRLKTRSGKDTEVLPPLYLREPQKFFRYEFLDDLNAAYIQFKANTDFTGAQNIDAFLDSVSGQLRKKKPSYILLDQRFNVGGDLNITRELMQSIPDYLGFNGQIYIITSNTTFSAGISSVGYLKQVAGDKALIVGEPIGDALEFWAEGDLKMLPNSELAFLMATERHNYMTGCPEDDCHRSIQRHPIKVETLHPDLPAPMTWADYANDVDPSLRAIKEHILEGRENP